MKKILTLIEGKHFSRAGLADWMNENCPKKGNESKYTSRDVQQYAIRGNLPAKCGGYPIKEIKTDRQGLFVEVDFKSKSKTDGSK